MTLKTYLTAAANGMELISQCQGYSCTDLELLGSSPQHAKELLGLCETYYGATTLGGRQRRARAAARGLKHDLRTLVAIESYARRLSGPRNRWKLREKLCGTSVGDIPRVARDFLRFIKPQGPAAGVRITRRRQGNHTLSITASSLDIADMAGVLKNLDPQSLLEAVKSLFFDNPATSVPSVSTNVIIKLEELDAVVRGKGQDVVLTLTNGATMTGAEFITRTLTDFGFVTLVHPQQGPVNLYRTQRFASSKQRLMLGAVYPHCVWPDCQLPADECQYHHIHGWENGGQTNVDNLVPLCKYHNGVNDDSGLGDKRGKIVIFRGKPAWLPLFHTTPQPIASSVY